MGVRTSSIILLLLLLSSCGFFSRKVESIVEKAELKNTPVVKPAKKNLYCSEHSKLQFVIEDEPTLKFYRPLMNTLFENKTYSFVQKAAMFSLIEMLRRPDVASPTSRLQFFLRLKGKDYYFDFTTINKDMDSAMPYLKAIEYLNRTFDGRKDLQRITEILDSVVPVSINVSPEFENFLQLHRSEISKNEDLIEYFYKGDEILTKHESFKRLSFKKFYQQYLLTKNNADSLYSYNEFPLINIDTGMPYLQLHCNLDINKETITKEDILQNTITKDSHYFAMMEDNNFFIAVSSSVNPKKFTNIKGTYFINTMPPSMPLPLCEYKNKIQDIILYSTKGRFPTQHLRHLVSYDIGLANSQANLEELLTFSRHLFLSNPDRILYESKRGRKAQLDFFLSMNFPIYHVSALGDIMGAAIFTSPSENSKSLIVDDRSSARLRCTP